MLNVLQDLFSHLFFVINLLSLSCSLTHGCFFSGEEESTGSTKILTLISSGLLGAVGAIIITGLILAFTYWKKTQHR